MVQKGSTPWSTRTVAEGGTDSPVGDLVPVPDSVQPVINAGFIDESGKWRISAAADDGVFTFQDPSQALGAGATIYIDPINMLIHDLLILAVLDTSGNAVSVSLAYDTGAAPVEGPYANSTFTDTGVFGSVWRSNDPGDLTGTLQNILDDSAETLADTWHFYKIGHLRGTVGKMRITSNEGADAGTISTAYLRLV